MPGKNAKESNVCAKTRPLKRKVLLKQDNCNIAYDLVKAVDETWTYSDRLVCLNYITHFLS